MEERNMIFEIEGIPTKTGLFKKQRSYIAVFDDEIFIEYDGEKDTYVRDDIYDIYIKEPVIGDVFNRTLVIDFCEAGEWNFYELDDDAFPGLSIKMERALENEWSHITKKRDYPETVKWFVACCSVLQIVSGLNPFVYGDADKAPERMSAQRESMLEWWGVSDKNDLLEILPTLLDGRTVKQYKEDTENSELLKKSERCFWAWDLQRLILLGSLGHFCDYLSWEESLDWCLLAGQKLQRMFDSWDDFMINYLRGYSIWSREELDDENSEAYERKQVYEHYKKMPHNPWLVPWDLLLVKEW